MGNINNKSQSNFTTHLNLNVKVVKLDVNTYIIKSQNSITLQDKYKTQRLITIWIENEITCVNCT